MQTIIYLATTTDPWLNLAREEYLLDHLLPDQAVFYLWQNQNTVVIGKNQNPWRECQVKLLEQENGKLARRTSGGGAVFHDLGNLNFTFVVPREIYNLERQLGVILQACHQLGLAAQFQGRNDLTIQGRKFSGNAFCLRASTALHHGTLLVSADLDKLTRYLQVSQEKMQAKGIVSVRSRVINLSECQPTLTIPTISNALVTAFENEYGKAVKQYHNNEGMVETDLEHLYQHHSSWEWRLGKSPHFDITLDTRFSWGGIEICLSLKEAHVTQSQVYSDAMDEAFITQLAQIFQGCRFDAQTLSHRIQQWAWPLEQKAYADDVANWLMSKQF